MVFSCFVSLNFVACNDDNIGSKFLDCDPTTNTRELVRVKPKCLKTRSISLLIFRFTFGDHLPLALVELYQPPSLEFHAVRTGIMKKRQGNVDTS